MQAETRSECQFKSFTCMQFTKIQVNSYHLETHIKSCGFPFFMPLAAIIAIATHTSKKTTKKGMSRHLRLETITGPPFSDALSSLSLAMR